MKPGRFKITSYSMGMPRATVEVVGTLTDAQARAERMPAHGMAERGGKTRVVGIKRVGN